MSRRLVLLALVLILVAIAAVVGIVWGQEKESLPEEIRKLLLNITGGIIPVGPPSLECDVSPSGKYAVCTRLGGKAAFVVDLSKLKIIAWLPLPPGTHVGTEGWPKAVQAVFISDNLIAVTGYALGTNTKVCFYTPRGGSLGCVDVPDQEGVWLTPYGGGVYIATTSGLWIGYAAPGSGRFCKLPCESYAIWPLGGDLVFTTQECELRGAVVRITSNKTCEIISVFKNASAICWLARDGYVACGTELWTASGRLVKDFKCRILDIDALAGDVIVATDCGLYSLQHGLLVNGTFTAVDHFDKYIVAGTSDGYVYVIDAETREVETVIYVGYHVNWISRNVISTSGGTFVLFMRKPVKVPILIVKGDLVVYTRVENMSQLFARLGNMSTSQFRMIAYTLEFNISAVKGFRSMSPEELEWFGFYPGESGVWNLLSSPVILHQDNVNLREKWCRIGKITRFGHYAVWCHLDYTLPTPPPWHAHHRLAWGVALWYTTVEPIPIKYIDELAIKFSAWIFSQYISAMEGGDKIIAVVVGLGPQRYTLSEKIIHEISLTIASTAGADVRKVESELKRLVADYIAKGRIEEVKVYEVTIRSWRELHDWAKWMLKSDRAVNLFLASYYMQACINYFVTKYSMDISAAESKCLASLETDFPRFVEQFAEEFADNLVAVAQKMMRGTATSASKTASPEGVVGTTIRIVFRAAFQGVRYFWPALIGTAVAEGVSWILWKPHFYDKALVGAMYVIHDPRGLRFGLTTRKIDLLTEKPAELPEWVGPVAGTLLPVDYIIEVPELQPTATQHRFGHEVYIYMRGGRDLVQRFGISPSAVVGNFFFYYIRYMELQRDLLGTLFGLGRDVVIVNDVVLMPVTYTAVAVVRELRNPSDVAWFVKRYLRIPGAKIVNVTVVNNTVRVTVAVPGYEILPYLGDLTKFVITGTIRAGILLLRLCSKMSEYGYVCTFHFTPPGGKIAERGALRIRKVYILNIPVNETVLFIERLWTYRVGNVSRSEWGIVWVNKQALPEVEKLYRFTEPWILYKRYGDMFEEVTYKVGLVEKKGFVSRVGSEWLDPSNGGLLQNCKHYVFKIWTRIPPDAAILGILFNGTEVTSTIPHYATIVMYSTVPQRVVVRFRVLMLVLENRTLVPKGVLAEKDIVVNFTEPGLRLVPIPIGELLERAYKPMQLAARNATFTMWLGFEAKIVHAEYNYIESNDYAIANTTFPVPYWKGTAVLIVRVYNGLNGRPIANATVKVWMLPAGKLVAEGKTNSTGYVVFTNLTFGLRYRVCGYYGTLSGCEEILLNQLIYFLNLALKPANLTATPVGIPPAPAGYHSLVVKVVYEDGKPFQCAYVRVLLGGGVLCFGHTNGRGYMACAVKHGLTVTVLVEAKVGGKVYRFNKTVTVDRDLVLKFVVPVLSPAPPAPGAPAILAVKVYDYMTGKPVPSAYVEVWTAGEERKFVGAEYTNASGVAEFNVTVCGKYNITVRPPAGWKSYKPWYIVHVDRKYFILNVPVVRANYTPPPAVYWRVTVLVVYKNDVPYTGAHVDIYDARTGKLIAQGATNSRGQLIVYIPNCTVINIHVSVPEHRYDVWKNGTHVNNHLTIVFRLPVQGNVTVPPGLTAVLAVRAYVGHSLAPVASAQVLISGYYYYPVRVTVVTDENGTAATRVMRYHYYNVTLYHPDYVQLITPLEVYVAYNLTRVYIPCAPAAANITNAHVGNATIARSYIYNNVTYVPLLVQVLYRDGAPVQGAAVTVKISNATSYTLMTDGRGFIYLWLPRGTENITVQVYYTEKNMTLNESRFIRRLDEGVWLVFRAGWRSRFFKPEVMIMRVEVRVWAGAGHTVFGPVKHSIYTWIWTNYPQNVTVLYEVWEVLPDGKPLRLLQNFTKTYRLARGLNPVVEFFVIDILNVTYVRVHAVIIRCENDTVTDNNEAWSNIVKLVPEIDLQVYAEFVPVKLKVPPFVIPEDKVVLRIVVFSPVAARIPVTYCVDMWYVLPWGERKGMLHICRHAVLLGKNMTFAIPVTVPWGTHLAANVTISSPYDTTRVNNVYTASMSISSELRIVNITLLPSMILEEQNTTLILYFRTNTLYVPVLVAFSVLGTSINKTVVIIPDEKKLDYRAAISFTAPEAQPIFGPLRVPKTYKYSVTVSGPDTYFNDSAYTGTFTVYPSWARVAVFAGLVFAILFAVAVLAALIGAAVRRRRGEMRETEFV